MARQLKKGTVSREPYEHMKIKVLKAKTAYRLLWTGKIIHSPTVSALGLAEKIILG